LAEKNSPNISVQSDFAQELAAKGRIEDAGMIYQRILKTIDYSNKTAREKLIAVLMRSGKLEEALRIIDAAGILAPSNTSYYLVRSKIYASRDEYDYALKEARKALEICPDDPVLMDFLGEYLLHVSDSDKAFEVWTKTLRLNPNFVLLQRYLDWKEATGDSFETPYKENLDSIIKRAAAIDQSASQYSTYYLLNQSVVKLNRDGTARQYLHRIIKITGEKGVKELQQIQLPYNPETQKLKVINCRILYPNGRSLDGIYAGGSFIKIPPLEIGAIIDLEYRCDDIQQGFFGTYYGDIFFLGASNPVYKSAYTIITPSDRPLYFNLRNIKLEPKIINENNYTAYVWTAFDVPGFISEPLMPPLGEVIPLIQVSTYKEWKEFGKWYWNLIKKQYDINDDMRDMLKRIIHPMMNTKEKITAVYNFTIGVIRYVAWEFGIHGWKPYKASTIFARRFGDCKDKATIINVLLNELGVKSYPVLIYADDRKGEDDLTLPLVEHFNHCIAYTKMKNGKDVWLDGTAVFNRAGTVPATDTDAKVFVINEEGGEIKYIPPISPTDNGRHEINEISLHKNGRARIEAGVTFIGEQSGELRFMLFNQAKQSMVVERMFGPRFGGTQITSIETSPLNRLDIPTSLTVTANVPYFMSREGRDFSFKPVLFPQELAVFVTQSERKFDLLLSCFQFPYEDNIHTIFTLPIDMKVKSLPENISIDNEIGTFIVNYKVEGDTIIYTEKVSIKNRRIKTKDYKAFRMLCNKIAMEEEREIIITPDK
jgi:tetratricopeptide (TPR) repeat protein